jgi:Fe2+ or Zn2+ uptake regulation protein
MKIKITENQAKRLNVLKENINPIENLKQYVKIKSGIVDNLYNKLVNLSVYELLTEKIDFNQIDRMLMVMEDEIHVLIRQSYSYIEDLPDEGLDRIIDETEEELNGKISSIHLLISVIEKVPDLEDEYKITKDFINNGPLDITGIQ